MKSLFLPSFLSFLLSQSSRYGSSFLPSVLLSGVDVLMLFSFSMALLSKTKQPPTKKRRKTTKWSERPNRERILQPCRIVCFLGDRRTLISVALSLHKVVNEGSKFKSLFPGRTTQVNKCSFNNPENLTKSISQSNQLIISHLILAQLLSTSLCSSSPSYNLRKPPSYPWTNSTKLLSLEG